MRFPFESLIYPILKEQNKNIMICVWNSINFINTKANIYFIALMLYGNVVLIEYFYNTEPASYVFDEFENDI